MAAGLGSVGIARKSNGVVTTNASASLVDVGDGVGCIEFHSKMNTASEELLRLVTQSLKAGGPGDGFDAFVITNDAENFCAGANLVALLTSVQDQKWDEVDAMIRSFQQATSAIKFSPKPVVVAPFGLTLGGGCEIALHGAVRQPHAELYMGFAEPGVGLLPAGCGCKEMLLHAADAAKHLPVERRAGSVEMIEAVKRAFETIAMAKISASAEDARNLGLLSDCDRVTMNRERVLADAKSRALELARAGYKSPVPRTDIPAPGEAMLSILKLGLHVMRQGEFISDHDQLIGTKIAEVLCGGAVTSGSLVSEQYILDLEREGFKSLCGERKTQERIQHTLKTGKPLRN